MSYGPISDADLRMYPNRVMVEYSCENCGCGFSSIKPEPKYCSRECYEEVLADQMPKRVQALWRDPKFVERIRAARKAAGYRVDPASALRARIRAVIKSALHRCLKAGAIKAGRTVDLLGYTPDQLRAHIESQFAQGMSWANYGEWEIDHVRPIASFAVGTPVSVINALGNLQPLWGADNRRKGRHVRI